MNTLTSFKLLPVDFQHIDLCLGSNSEALRRSKILITGVTGFFGKLLLESLIWLNVTKSLDMDIHVVVRNTQIFKESISLLIEKKIHIIEGDLSTLTFRTYPYKYIIHLASEAIKPDIRSSFLSHMSRSVAAANNLIDLASVCEADSILFTSSGAVYGDYLGMHFPNLPYVENTKYAKDILNEKAVYSETKRYLELLFSTASDNYNFKVKIARCFSFVGPYLPLNSNYAIGNFIRDALQGHDIIINGDGKPFRSYLYATDLVIYLLLILIKGRNNIPYNVGSPEKYSIQKVAEMVLKISASKSKIQVLNTLNDAGAGRHYIPDLKNIKDDFGLNNIVPLCRAIEKTIKWNKIFNYEIK